VQDRNNSIRRGTYLLLLTFSEDAEVSVGSLGTVNLCAGTYCYVGSAMGGLDQRVGRHLSKDKKVRWHIDRLTLLADSMHAYESYPDFVPECELASVLESSGGIPAVKGFGCSDCSCFTHLFRVEDRIILDIVSRLGLNKFHPDD